ncbi:MAG: metalloregulator ArsR/SmtB family transcription factor [Candidatus Uhrbacteria bacterium]|nr:metalloregulator ArsR/SmtB family transcription factor [Candidatus Uhrbacteria bacterium]
MKDLEKILKGLANRRRLSILWHLKKRKTASVGELAEAIDLSFNATSKHLAKLKALGVIHREQYGKKVVYHISPEQSPAASAILDLLE